MRKRTVSERKRGNEKRKRIVSVSLRMEPGSLVAVLLRKSGNGELTERERIVTVSSACRLAAVLRSGGWRIRLLDVRIANGWVAYQP
jgi:hypothetical protein